MSTHFKSAVVGLSLLASGLWANAAGATPQHPCLLLKPVEVATIRASLGQVPLFDAALAEAKERVDHALTVPLSVPVPADAAGPTHERHKQNYTEMQLAGFLY